MKAIVVADRNWAIGRDGDLLARLPKDMKRFKEITEGNYVVMGRKTLESLPGGKPLPNRENIVLTRNKFYRGEGFVTLPSLGWLQAVHKVSGSCDVKKDFFIIGGGEIYKETLPWVNEVILTQIDNSFLGCDTYFPNLERSSDWEEISREDEVLDGYYSTSYIVYRRRKT